MTRAAITRRGLVTAGAATLGAAALPTLLPVPAMAGTPSTAAAGAAGPDAALFELLSRRAPALAAAQQADADLARAEEITGAAWNAKPDALWRGPRDTHLDLSPSSIPSEDGSPRPFYTVDDAERMAAEMEGRAGITFTPYQVEQDARRREIIAAHAAWQAQVDEAQAATGYDALCDRLDVAWNALGAIEREIMRMPARTLAGLCAKAALAAEVADRRELEHVPVDFAREVAAFQVAI